MTKLKNLLYLPRLSPWPCRCKPRQGRQQGMCSELAFPSIALAVDDAALFGMAVWRLASRASMRYRDIENGEGPDCTDVLKYSFEFIL